MNKKILLMSIIALSLILLIGITAIATDKVYFGTFSKGMENPYCVEWGTGAEAFAKSVGLEGHDKIFFCGFDSEKQLDDLRAFVADKGPNCTVNIDPNQSPDVRPIVELLESKGIYFVTQWNKPEDMNPWDYKYWVAHITFSDYDSGYNTTMEIIKTLNGKGNIAALQGQLANTAATERFRGLKAALKEYPNIKLLDNQSANWLRQKAYDITQNYLIAYPKIDAIWCANDNMALGTVEALRSQGLAGKTYVTGCDGIAEAFEMIKKGEILATVLSDAHWQGGIGHSLAYKAYKGELNPSSLPKDKRFFKYQAPLITKKNVDIYVKNYIKGMLNYDWDNPFPSDHKIPIKK